MFKIYFEGDNFFEQLFRDIEKAKKNIYIEVYIFQYNIIGEQLLDLLIKKSKQNLEIKILVDGIGTRDFIQKIIRKIEPTSIEFLVYKPFIFPLLFKSGYHRRNHRKLIIIDEAILFTGGMNIKDVFSKKIYNQERWRDTMIRIENHHHNEIKKIFLQSKIDFLGLWKITRKKLFFLPKKIPIIPQLMHNQNYIIFSSINRKRRRIFRKFYYEFIKRSKKFLYIATPYFVPTRKIINLLKEKAEMGVDVQILTAGNTDVWLARQAGRSTYSSLLKSGIQIYEFSERIFHAKQTLSENGIIIGSTNIDYRSFLHNLEIDLFLNSEILIQNCLQQWKKDLKESQKIHPISWNQRSKLEKITEKLAYGIRYYL